jgi:hypothetical protein
MRRKIDAQLPSQISIPYGRLPGKNVALVLSLPQVFRLGMTSNTVNCPRHLEAGH